MRSISSVALKLTSTSCVVKEFPVEGSKAKGSKAILFGWAGGSLQLVEKYVPLWNSAVSSVIVVATPLSVVKMLPENEVSVLFLSVSRR
jgi:hypothetical protein